MAEKIYRRFTRGTENQVKIYRRFTRGTEDSPNADKKLCLGYPRHKDSPKAQEMTTEINMECYPVRSPIGDLKRLMGYLSGYMAPREPEQWHCWRIYTSACGKLVLKPGTFWWHKDAGWKSPLCFVAVVERVELPRLRFAVVIPPPDARVYSGKLLQWVAFTTRTGMLDAPVTLVAMQKALCFRPVAAHGMPGPPLAACDTMCSDEALLDFINRCTTASTCKHQIELFHALHGVAKEHRVAKQVQAGDGHL